MAEGLLNGSPDGLGFDVTVNGEDAVVGAGQFFMERFQIARLDFLHAGFSAQDVQTVTGLAEEGAAHGFGGALKQLVSLRPDRGQLDLAFAFEGRSGKSRMEQNVGEQGEPDREITAQDFGVDAETIVAAVAVQAPAHRLDFAGDVLGGTRSEEQTSE